MCNPHVTVVIGDTLLLLCDLAELGDYSEADNSPGYLSEFCFIPNQPQGFEKDVTKNHQQHRWGSQIKCATFPPTFVWFDTHFF